MDMTNIHVGGSPQKTDLTALSMMHLVKQKALM